MPIKYVGKSLDYKGKTLWEILGNLRNYGLGRYVRRSFTDRYSEPCFMKIVKVETCPSPEFETPDDVRKVCVWAEEVFRGRLDPNPIKIYNTSYKADYVLVSKDMESEVCKIDKSYTYDRVLPQTTSFPPLLKELIIRDMEAKGEKVKEEPKMTLVYRQSREGYYRVAKEGEKPNVELVSNVLDNPKAIHLYKDVKV